MLRITSFFRCSFVFCSSRGYQTPRSGTPGSPDLGAWGHGVLAPGHALESVLPRALESPAFSRMVFLFPLSVHPPVTALVLLARLSYRFDAISYIA